MRGRRLLELAIHLGPLRAGSTGLVVAGLSFIAPACLFTLACAWAHVRFGSLPVADRLLYGVKPVIIAVVLQALWGLGRTATRTPGIAAVGLASLAAVAGGAHELLVPRRFRLARLGGGPGRAGARGVVTAACMSSGDGAAAPADPPERGQNPACT